MKLTLSAVIAALAAACAFLTTAAAQSKDPSPPGRPADQPDPAKPGQESDTPERPGRGEAASDPAPADDADFIQKAAAKGMGEVKLAELGVTKAHDGKVKECAQMLVKDHTAANQELKVIAGDLKIRLDEAADADADADGKYGELNEKAGKEFDKAFLEHMATRHEKGIALFEAGKKAAKAEQLTAFIEKTLPMLKHHAEHIAKVGGWETRDPVPRPRPVVDPAPDNEPPAGPNGPGNQPLPGTTKR